MILSPPIPHKLSFLWLTGSTNWYLCCCPCLTGKLGSSALSCLFLWEVWAVLGMSWKVCETCSANFGRMRKGEEGSQLMRWGPASYNPGSWASCSGTCVTGTSRIGLGAWYRNVWRKGGRRASSPSGSGACTVNPLDFAIMVSSFPDPLQRYLTGHWQVPAIARRPGS